MTALAREENVPQTVYVQLGRFAVGKSIAGMRRNGKGFLEESENILFKTIIARLFILSSKCTKNRFVAGLCLDPLGERISALPARTAKSSISIAFPTGFNHKSNHGALPSP